MVVLHLYPPETSDHRLNPFLLHRSIDLSLWMVMLCLLSGARSECWSGKQNLMFLSSESAYFTHILFPCTLFENFTFINSASELGMNSVVLLAMDSVVSIKYACY